MAKETFTTSSTYKANLEPPPLHLNHPSNRLWLLYNFFYSHHHKAYTIGLCRGDVKHDSCTTCLNYSTTLLTKNCPTPN
uniref:Gnk2-homologous domain-containing protein n=1 Tax=Cucumis melo TaxID=3656 RepID=A0A9I9EMB3_CUCME